MKSYFEALYLKLSEADQQKFVQSIITTVGTNARNGQSKLEDAIRGLLLTWKPEKK